MKSAVFLLAATLIVAIGLNPLGADAEQRGPVGATVTTITNLSNEGGVVGTTACQFYLTIGFERWVPAGNFMETWFYNIYKAANAVKCSGECPSCPICGQGPECLLNENPLGGVGVTCKCDS